MRDNMFNIKKDLQEKNENRYLALDVLILILSCLISFVISFFSEKDGVGKIIYPTLLMSIAFYSAAALFRILVNMLTSNIRMEKIEENVEKSSILNNTHNTFTQNLLKIFEHNDDYMKSPVIVAFNLFIGSMRVEQDYISLKSSYIAIEAYNEFWRMLTKLQTQALHKAVNIPVFVTHSSSIRLWNTQSSAEMLGIQSLFIQEGGKIFRIVIRNENSEDMELYCNAMEKMRRSGVRVYFIDTTETKSPIYNEFVVVKINGEWYSVVWQIRWETYGLYGTIEGCEVFSGVRAKKYHEQWLTVVGELENSSTDHLDSRFTTAHKKPSQGELTEMRQPPPDWII